jgi:hypothetical protein
MHLAHLGYGAYAREINEFHPDKCSEYTFMHVKKDVAACQPLVVAHTR